MRRFDIPVAPVLVGMILGPLAEQQFRRALAISQGDLSIFVTQPISATVLAITALVLFGPPIWRRIVARRSAATQLVRPARQRCPPPRQTRCRRYSRRSRRLPLAESVRLTDLRTARTLWRGVASVAVGAAAGWLCQTVSTPIPWMLGPMFALALLRIAGADLVALPGGREAGQWIIGTALGLYFTPR